MAMVKKAARLIQAAWRRHFQRRRMAMVKIGLESSDWPNELRHFQFKKILGEGGFGKNSWLLVLEFMPGGDMENVIIARGKLKETPAKFYACEIICALEFLYTLGIIHRDLKLENTLINEKGHIRLADFGLSKVLKKEKTKGICGTTYYMAPEMLEEQPYDQSVDWWSFGVMLYRMLTGEHPFYAEEEEEIERAILYSAVYYPDHLSNKAEDCLTQLLDRSPPLRLGYKKGHFPRIREDPFFGSVSWEDLEAEMVEPPYVPSSGGADWIISSLKSDERPDCEHSARQSSMARRRDSYFPSID